MGEYFRGKIVINGIGVSVWGLDEGAHELDLITQ